MKLNEVEDEEASPAKTNGYHDVGLNGEINASEDKLTQEKNRMSLGIEIADDLKKPKRRG